VIPSRWGRTLREKLFLHVRPFRENLSLQLQITASMLLVFYFAMLSVTNDKPIIFIIVRQGVPTHCSGFGITLRTRSVGLLWMGDWPVAKTSTWIHIPLTRDRHPSPQRDSIRNPSRQATAEPRLRQRGHWGRLICILASDTYEYEAAMIMTEGNR